MYRKPRRKIIVDGSIENTRLAAVGDLHVTVSSQGQLQAMFAEINEKAHILALCGDLTDYGLPEEAHVLARELAALRIPIVAVLGNHDFESGHQDQVRKILIEAGVAVLDGEAKEIGEVGFAGVKGFGGGFGSHALQPWGEATTKKFVHEALDETLKLESALAKIRAPHRIALLHYAPVHGTVTGEPLEIWPYLGSSRLAEPIDRYQCHAVFHGHAHHGALEARTRGQVPVYNVAMPLLRRLNPSRHPYFLMEVAPVVTV